MADVALQPNGAADASRAQTRQPAQRAEAQIDRGVPDDAAADPPDRDSS